MSKTTLVPSGVTTPVLSSTNYEGKDTGSAASRYKAHQHKNVLMWKLTFSISLTTAFRCCAVPYFNSFSTTLLANFCLDICKRPFSTTIFNIESRSE